MPAVGKWWSRLAAATVLVLLIGVAVALHRPAAPVAGDDHAGHAAPVLVPAAVSTPAPLPRTGWTVTADDAQASAPAVLDGDPATAWRATSGSPHWLTIDTHNRVAFGGLTYLPPADGSGRIEQYRVEVSDDGTSWGDPVATGTFADDATLKTVTVATLVTRFVRLTAVTGDPRRGRDRPARRHRPGAAPHRLDGQRRQRAGSRGPAVNAIDGNTATAWQPRHGHVAAHPHRRHARHPAALRPVLPARPGRPIGQYRIETSTDGATWGPATAGTFPGGATAQTVTFDPALARYARLSVVTGTAAVAEINLLGRADPTLTRTGWAVSSDSSATGYPVSNVLDGNPATFWHSALGTTPKPLPHTLIIDLRKAPRSAG